MKREELQHGLGEVPLRELCARAGIRPVGGKPLPDTRVSAITDDSRAVVPGACFVAVQGTGRDAHEFVPQAIERGAVVVIVERELGSEVVQDDRLGRAIVVRVGETRTALARLAAAFHGVAPGDRHALRLVGVTGTNGKSTVAWLMRSIIEGTGARAAMLGTIEYDVAGRKQKAELTTPGSVALCRMLAEAERGGAKFGVMEVSSHALDQRRCDGLAFDAAVFTNLSGDHLDYHRTMEDYFAAKRRLFELVDGGSMAVVNVDDPAGVRLAKTIGGRLLTFGIEALNADLRGEIGRLGRSGSEFVVHGPGWRFDCRLRLVGRHNVSNALAAAGAAHALGFDIEAIRKGLERVSGVPGRLQRVEPDGTPFSVLVDYAHTDAALENVLTALRPITSGRLICVFGCGGDRDRTKRPRMATVVGKLADAAFVTSDNPRSEAPEAIIQEILPGFGVRSRCVVEVESDRRLAIASAIASAKAGDTILIAGKGHEDYQIIGDRVLHFDDVEVARECLSGSLAVEAVA